MLACVRGLHIIASVDHINAYLRQCVHMLCTLVKYMYITYFQSLLETTTAVVVERLVCCTASVTACGLCCHLLNALHRVTTFQTT